MRSLLTASTLVLLLLNMDNSWGLKILLTNEDGIEAEGMQRLRTELIKKGHKVWTFAPKNDQTGMGAALNMPTVSCEPYGDEADKMFSVDGYPASAILLGLTKMDEMEEAEHQVNSGLEKDKRWIHEPDLVRICGIFSLLTIAACMRSNKALSSQMTRYRSFQVPMLVILVVQWISIPVL